MTSLCLQQCGKLRCCSLTGSERSSLNLRELTVCSVGRLSCHVHSSGDDFLFSLQR
ncbi:hypothetical protein ACRRTK_013761 [Alexandromys fortis]